MYKFLIIALLGLTCKQKLNNENKTTTEAVKLTTVEWKNTTYEFTNIYDGDKCPMPFYFTNTGKEDLIVTGKFTDCGCTRIKVPTYPIKPGATDSIMLFLNTNDRPGYISKTAKITMNTNPNTFQLSYEGEVLTKR
jgi:hypothetical protein